MSGFNYTYDAAGNIVRWRQQADSDLVVEWTYAYDMANQLTAAVSMLHPSCSQAVSLVRYR